MRARPLNPNAPAVEGWVDPLAEIKANGGSTASGSAWHQWKTGQLGYDPYSVNRPTIGSTPPIPTFKTGEVELGYKSPDYGTLTGWRGGNPLFDSTPDDPDDDLTEVDIVDFGRRFRESNPIPKPTGTPEVSYSFASPGLPPIPQTTIPPAQFQNQPQAPIPSLGFGGVQIPGMPSLSQNVGMSNNPMAKMFPEGWPSLGDNYASLFDGGM